MKWLVLWFIVINLTGYLFMGYDKRQARRGGWRVPEARLFLLGALGGALGEIAGMRVFRHKTKHLSFVIGLPAILIFQLAAAIWFIR